jgi:hypothetical protein
MLENDREVRECAIHTHVIAVANRDIKIERGICGNCDGVMAKI